MPRNCLLGMKFGRNLLSVDFDSGGCRCRFFSGVN